MASLVNDDDKLQIEQALVDVFDTFKRTLTVYLEPARVVVVSDPSYNPYFSSPQDQQSVENVPQPITIYGTIRHKDKQTYQFIKGDDSQIKVKNALGECRIDVQASDAQTLFGAKAFTVDGFNYTLNGAPRPHGMFEPAFYTFYLERTQ